MPDDQDRSSFQNWKSDTFKRIAEACERNHRKAFRKYIKVLIADRAKLEEYVQARSAYFVRHVCDEYDGDVARDVAEKFGLIYAAGRLGIQCELLPWDKSDLLDAITKCYIGTRNLLPDDGVAIRQGVTALRAKLRKLPSISKKAVSKTDFDKIDGYRECQKNVNRSFIKRDVFNSIFASGTQRALVIEWLIQQQRITLATPKASAGAPSSQPQEQFIWADHKRRRSFEILWPRKPKVKKTARKIKGD
ncbi:MAG: hypothetical protein ACLPKT_15600 [Methylocella sp.]